MNRYETHCHTSESSACAHATAKEAVLFYQSLNYAGIFVSDHFICGNNENSDWEQFVEKTSKGFETAKAFGDTIQFPVFYAFEYTHKTYRGTDFLVYGLNKEFLLEHPEIDSFDLKEALTFFRSSGGFIVQAHPFRESAYIGMIRLLPFQVDGIEISNANRSERENFLAKEFAAAHKLIPLAGSDNHLAHNQKRLCGIETEEAINGANDLIAILKSGNYSLFDTDKKM